MNPGQQQFFNFILERVSEGKEEIAKDLLGECFEQQDNGTFDAAAMMQVMPKLYATLKEECVAEVRAITEQFGKRMAK